MSDLPPALAEELTRARRIVARADLDPAWVEGAQDLAQQWADAESTARGWPAVAVVAPSAAALPDVLAAVATATWHSLATSPGNDNGEGADQMAADLAALRRHHGG